MTFKNSWIQCLIALILWLPLTGVLIVILGIIFNAIGFPLDSGSLSGSSYIIALAILYYLVRWDVKRRLLKKQIV